MAMRVWQRQRIEDAERLEAMRAHIRRSITPTAQPVHR
jgi:hypothetical protein